MGSTCPPQLRQLTHVADNDALFSWAHGSVGAFTLKKKVCGACIIGLSVQGLLQRFHTGSCTFEMFNGNYLQKIAKKQLKKNPTTLQQLGRV